MPYRMSKIEQRLNRYVGLAVRKYRLIENGDKIMVALSGGKDSHVLLHFLDLLRQRLPVSFEWIAVHIDQRQPGYDGKPLEDYLQKKGYPYRIFHHDTYSIVQEKTLPGQTRCFMCSRLRRGILYNTAVELGCTKIALGHHREDVLETLLLNLAFNSQLKAMPPRLVSDDRRNIVIRPLILCAEREIAKLAEELEVPILPCGVCGAQKSLRRVYMRGILDTIEAENPGAMERMIAGLANVRPSHLLDLDLWRTLQLPGTPFDDVIPETQSRQEIIKGDDTYGKSM